MIDHWENFYIQKTFTWEGNYLLFHSYSESSYLTDQVLANVPHLPSNSNYTFLLWELIFDRPGIGRPIPPSNGNFTDSCSDSSYFIPTLRTHIWQARCWQIYPPTGQTVIIDSYSKSSYLAMVGRSQPLPPQIAISQIPALTAHMSFLLWELIFGRQGVGRTTPIKQWL